MCTSVAVGKRATSDGTIVIARNEDFGVNNWNKYIKYRVNPQYYGLQDYWTLGNGLKVPVPQKSFSYCSIPDAEGNNEASDPIGDYYFFEERGINQCNVAISATNSMDINDRAKACDPPVSPGIEEAIILTLILPQAESALEAVELLGNYVETYGASEGNGVLISDVKEAWYLEIGSGHNWCAVKIPEDSYLVIANGMRIHSIDLDNNDNVKHSKDLFEFVCKYNLLENPERNNFNFAKAFGISGSVVTVNSDSYYDPYYNVDRIWLAQKILTPTLKQKIRMEEYPLFLKPDQRISVNDIMTVLRATYKNTELEGIATRPIGVVRTSESHIIAIDPDMPGTLKGVIWQALSSPLGAPYMPLFAATENIPQSYSTGFSQYNPNSAYWSFRGLFALSSVAQYEFMPKLKKLWGKYENQFMKEHPYIKNTIKDMVACDNYEEATSFAQKYSTGVLCQVVEAANYELETLITEIAANQKD